MDSASVASLIYDDDDERDMPITANDIKRRENAKKQAPKKYSISSERQ